MPREQGAVAELQQDQLAWRRQRRGADGLVRKAMGDALPRTAEPVPELLKLFGDHRDKQLVDALGAVISITRRQMRNEFGERLAEHVLPQLKKIAALELKVAELTGAVDVLRGAAPPPPAKLPRVRAWAADTVHHEGDVVTHEGATWQARCDTAQAPGTADWACVAKAGRDGASFVVRGTYNPADVYSRLDVVAYGGASFAARKSAPGPCPGPDWQLIAKIGKCGPRGERGITGLRGDRGEAAPAIRSWEVDRARYVATPVMSDGSRGPPLELHGLFEQFLLETQSL